MTSLADHRSVKLRVYLLVPPCTLHGKDDFYYARFLQLINIGLSPFHFEPVSVIVTIYAE